MASCSPGNLSMQRIVGVVGAGAMGVGIAEVAAAAGDRVRLFDTAPGAAARAAAQITERLRRSNDDRTNAPGWSGVADVDTLAELAGAELIVEAVVENLGVKRALFAELDRLMEQGAILATNTSSLSPTAIAAGLAGDGRVVGLHFFNPPTRMQLVEVVAAMQTTPDTVERTAAIARQWGKTVVLSSATPGYIVNRIARPFYAEAWRLLEARAADAATIDAVLTSAGGFRMGPFALMDMIGHDVNDAVTRTVWAGMGYDSRFAPSAAQRELVEAGRLGRKTGRGVYDYAAEKASAAPLPTAKPPMEVIDHGDTELGELLRRSGVAVLDGDGRASGAELPSGAYMVRCAGTTAAELAAACGSPVVLIDRTVDDATVTGIAIATSTDCTSEQRDEAVGMLQAAGLDVFLVDDTPGLVVTRTVAMIVNLAVDANQHGVARAADIDTAMRLATNYPLGPLEWGDVWGPETVVTVLDNLMHSEGDPRYRASSLLRRIAAMNGSLR
jgi:3-hydroxybutyryl-CoA dehydrogenase